jgi:hypothetical protein
MVRIYVGQPASLSREAPHQSVMILPDPDQIIPPSDGNEEHLVARGVRLRCHTATNSDLIPLRVWIVPVFRWIGGTFHRSKDPV